MTTGKVLVIEDEKDLRDIYEVILKHAGYDVRSAANGREGLAAAADFMPDIILLDIFMPIMDGKGFLESLKTGSYPDMRIIVCSNTSDTVLLSEMTALGADTVVTKADLDPKALTALVGTYTG